MPKVVPQYKEQARQRIVEAALGVFAEKGYHETTIEDVADRLGVSEGAIYLYFKSKRDLFKAIGESGERQIKQMIPSSIDAEDPIKAFINSAVKLSEQYESFYGLIFELLAEASRDASLKRIFREDFDEDCRTLEDFLKELRKRNLIGTNADIRSISMGLLALFYGYLISRVIGLRKDDSKQAYTEAMRVMLEGTLSKNVRLQNHV